VPNFLMNRDDSIICSFLVPYIFIRWFAILSSYFSDAVFSAANELHGFSVVFMLDILFNS